MPSAGTPEVHRRRRSWRPPLHRGKAVRGLKWGTGFESALLVMLLLLLMAAAAAAAVLLLLWIARDARGGPQPVARASRIRRTCVGKIVRRWMDWD
jgi:hypothetical protein